jgi:SPW repeat-containing protein
VNNPTSCEPKKRNRQRWFVAAAALWLFLAPSFAPQIAIGAMAGGVNDLAIWNAWASGLVLIAIFVATFQASRKWQAWGVAPVGAWLFISPWEVGFSGSPIPTGNALIIGLGLIATVTWVLSDEGNSLRRLSSRLIKFKRIELPPDDRDAERRRIADGRMHQRPASPNAVVSSR